MNANRYTAAMNLVAGALLAALLQGCASDGGGNGNGVSQAVYDALNAETAARTAEAAAEAARAAERAARTAAALATSEAEAARAAETQARAAEQAAKTAEATAKAESATTRKQIEEILNVPKAGTLAGSAGRAEAARLADAVAQAGGGAFLAHHINALGGSATYSGTASGQLAVRAQGDYLVRYGRFTATATMTADFDVAESTTMPGVRFPTAHIHDFRDASGSVLEGWLVNLHGPAAFAGNRLSGATSGITGSLAWTGVWLGSLYGGTATGAYPTSVAGGFQADAGTPLPVTTPEGRIDLYRDEGFAGVLGSFRACRPAGPACRF